MQGAGRHDAVGAGLPRHRGELVDHLAHDVGPADGEAAAAAVGLEGPFLHVGPAGRQDLVEQHGVLVVVEPADLGRPQEQAAVIGYGLEPLEFPDDLPLEGVEADVVGDDVDGIPDGNPVGVGAPDDRFDLRLEGLVLLEVVLGHLEPVEARCAGDHDVEALLLRDHQVAGRQRHGKLVVRAVRRRRTAAGPVVDLVGLDAQGAAHGLDGLAVLLCRSVRGTTGI